MEQILAKLEGVVEDHLEQQAEDDNYKSKAGELVMELQQTLQEEVNLRKRADEINGMIDNLRDILLKHKNINFSDLFKRYLADLNQNPQHFEGVNFEQGHVLAGAPRRRPEPVAEQAVNAAQGVQVFRANPQPIRWDEVRMVNPAEQVQPDVARPWHTDRDGVDFRIDRVFTALGEKVSENLVTVFLINQHRSLREMGWRAE